MSRTLTDDHVWVRTVVAVGGIPFIEKKHISYSSTLVTSSYLGGQPCPGNDVRVITVDFLVVATYWLQQHFGYSNILVTAAFWL